MTKQPSFWQTAHSTLQAVGAGVGAIVMAMEGVFVVTVTVGAYVVLRTVGMALVPAGVGPIVVYCGVGPPVGKAGVSPGVGIVVMPTVGAKVLPAGGKFGPGVTGAVGGDARGTGMLEGSSLGTPDGLSDGKGVGGIVGWLEGEAEGVPLGDSEGKGVGGGVGVRLFLHEPVTASQIPEQHFLFFLHLVIDRRVRRQVRRRIGPCRRAITLS